MSLRTIIIGFIVAIVSCMAGAYFRLVHMGGNFVVPPSPTELVSSPDSQEDELTLTGNISFLLIGEDNVEASRRSDTVAIVSLNISDRIIRVLSLPRDTRVDIPGHGFQKLNHAYAYGQQELLRATVDRLMGTRLNYYVAIDYDSFPKLVDLVGGVDLYVSKRLKYDDRRGKLHIDIPAGLQHLDGEKALHFVRFRHDALGDIGRIQRQQQFLKALLNKMFEPSNLHRLSSITTEMSSIIQTDIPPSMLLQLAYFLKKLEDEKGRIFFSMLPGKPAMFSNLSYWLPNVPEGINFLTASYEALASSDLAERRKKNNAIPSLSSMLSEDIEDANVSSASVKPVPTPLSVMQIVDKMPLAVAVLNGTGKPGKGQEVAEQLQRIGIDVVYTGNAKHSDYRASNVIYPVNGPEDARLAAQLLATLCAIPSSLVKQNRFAEYPSIIVGHDFKQLLQRLEDSYASR